MEPVLTLDPLPWMTAAPTRAVMAALEPGGAARFVGGSVRDALAGQPQAGDVDIATPSPPETVMELLAAAKIKAVPTGIAHGTVTAVIGAAHFEITTLRRDVATYGRHADVAFTDDWREDAARRDFTINAMSMTEAGAVFDYFGGLEDLKAGRVRFVGDAATRIREDVLRLLRFFRFHARYGKGAPDAEALEAARALAHLVPGLSGERIWAELARILTGPAPVATVTLMAEADVLPHVLPEAARRDRLQALTAIEETEGLGGAPDAIRRLAALVKVDDAGAEALAQRLRLSRLDRARLVHLARAGTSVAPDWTPADARRAIYRAGAGLFRDMVLLSWAEEMVEGPPPAAARNLSAAYSALLEIGAAFAPPVFPLGGADAAALGLVPGPEMGRALAAVEEWWLAEDFRPGREALCARLAAVVAGKA